MGDRPLVIVCSPYRGDVAAHTAYARRCLLDSILRGEVPIAPHLLYTQALDDDIPEEREEGIALSLVLIQRCDLVVAYVDRGLSGGMCAERDAAFAAGVPWEQRRIGRE